MTPLFQTWAIIFAFLTVAALFMAFGHNLFAWRIPHQQKSLPRLIEKYVLMLYSHIWTEGRFNMDGLLFEITVYHFLEIKLLFNKKKTIEFLIKNPKFTAEVNEPPPFQCLRVMWMTWLLLVSNTLMNVFASEMMASMTFRPEAPRIDTFKQLAKLPRMKMYVITDSATLYAFRVS